MLMAFWTSPMETVALPSPSPGTWRTTEPDIDDAARAEYEAFFTAWKNADADLRLLKLARREFAALARGPS